MQNTRNHQKEEFWQRHVNQAAAFEGSQKKYCEAHGLNQHTFTYWKQKLTADSALPRSNQFIPVSVMATSASERKMPDAKWVAEVLFEIYQRFQ